MLNGLAVNPAAPADVLVELIDRHGKDLKKALSSRREMPAALVDAMLHHPIRQVRCALGANLNVDLRTRVQLVDDPDPVVVFWVRHDRRHPLPAEAVDQYLEGFARVAVLGLLSESEARERLGLELWDDRRLLTPAARHPNPLVRATAVWHEDRLAPEDRRILRADSDPAVRAAYADWDADSQTIQLADLFHEPSFGRSMQLRRRLTREVVDHVLAADDTMDLTTIAENPTLPADAVGTLLAHSKPEIRAAAANRDDLTDEQLSRLADDPHPLVRNAVSVHPRLPEARRAAIDVDLSLVPGEGDFQSIYWTVQRGWTAAEVGGWVRSPNVLLRRRAAFSAELPPSLVPVLADDGDLGVRVLLALHSVDAPPPLLLRCYLEYEGPGRATLLQNPEFPREDYSKYAEHSDPARRRLVALDPDADPDVLAGLLYDPDPDVRDAVARSPRLAPDQIVELLGNAELAGAAAANPALPVPEMRRLIAEAL